MSFAWQGWSHRSIDNYAHWFGSNTFSSAISPIGYKNGTYGVGLFRFVIPTSVNGVTITKIDAVQLKLEGTFTGNGDLVAFIRETAPTDDTPFGWRRLRTSSAYLAISEPKNGLDTANTINFTIRAQLMPGQKYYICVCADNTVESQLNITSSWYPEIWIEYDTAALKLTYHQFNGANLISQNVVPGTYKAIEPGTYPIDNTTMAEDWKKNYGFFATWATQPSDSNNRRLDRIRVAPGSNITIIDDTHLYPLGALIQKFVSTTNTVKIAPYDNANTFSFALQGPSSNSGVSFDIPRELVENNALERRLLYVYQGDGWHLLHGPFPSLRDSKNYYTYRLTARSSYGDQFFNPSVKVYSVPLIALDARAIDLAAPQIRSWNDLRIGTSYRTYFPDYIVIPSSKIKPFASMDAEHYITIKLPVYKIQLKTFNRGVTDIAKSYCENSPTYWVESSSSSRISEYFTFADNYKGLLAQKENVRLESDITQSTEFFKSISNKLKLSDSSSLSMTPQGMPVATWQSLGNNSNSLVGDNVYNIVYHKSNITIQGKQNYNSEIYWVGSRGFIFVNNGNNIYIYRRGSFNIRADYEEKEFLYWEYNKNHYTTLDALIAAEGYNLLSDENPVIIAKHGDSNGFAYIKDNNNILQKYEIYYKKDDGTLQRCTPYVKRYEGISSASLLPLIFNAI